MNLNENAGTGIGADTGTDSTAAPLLPQTHQWETLPGDELWTVQLSQRLKTIYENGLPVPTVLACTLMRERERERDGQRTNQRERE